MAEQVLTLFPDTNFFIQCHAPQTLDWTAIGADWDEIRLLVCRPVQREIDQLKGRGNERTSRRARESSKLLRHLIEDRPVVFRDSPRIYLLLDSTRPDSMYDQQLDYTRADDQIVGTVAAFRTLNPETDARLLTHDVGPMVSAKSIGLPFIPIPDSWLLPRETSDQEKRIAALEHQLSRHLSAGPMVTITCLDAGGQKIEQIDVERVRFLALTDDHVATMLREIKTTLAMKTYAQTDPEYRLEQAVLRSSVLTAGLTFIPPSSDEIAEYHKNYDEWLKSCEVALRQWHDVANQRAAHPQASFIVKNEGSQPAKDALFSFEAEGRFKIARTVRRQRLVPSLRDEADDAMLPLPPTAPAGRMAGFSDPLGMKIPDLAFARFPAVLDPILSRNPLAPIVREPNEFYWKNDRKDKPTEILELECAQWRHGIEPHTIKMTLHLIDEEENASGALKCSIHAENLPEPLSVTFAVVIATRHESAADEAAKAVRSLIKRARRVRQTGQLP